VPEPSLPAAFVAEHGAGADAVLPGQFAGVRVPPRRSRGKGARLGM